MTATALHKCALCSEPCPYTSAAGYEIWIEAHHAVCLKRPIEVGDYVQRAFESRGIPRPGASAQAPRESPYAGDVERNLSCLRACMADCLRRGEAPFASHALYTQPGVLDDADPAQRDLGMAAGFAWREMAEATVVLHRPRSVASRGMIAGLKHAQKLSANGEHAIEYRELEGW